MKKLVLRLLFECGSLAATKLRNNRLYDICPAVLAGLSSFVDEVGVLFSVKIGN